VVELSFQTPTIKFSQILIFSVLILSTVVLLLPLQRKLDAFMMRLKEETISSLEKTLNRSISYDSISPTILLYLEVREVKVSTLSPHGRDNVEIGKIRVYYHFPSLFRGRIAAAVREIQIINSSFRLDQLRDAGLIRLIEGVSKERQSGPPAAGGEGLLPDSLKISGRNISIRYSDLHGHIQLRNLVFQMENREDVLQLELRGTMGASFAEGAELRVGEYFLREGRSSFRVTGFYSGRDQKLNAKLTLKDFGSNLFDFYGLTLRIERSPEVLRLTKIEDSAPYDFSLEYRPDNEMLQLKFMAEQFVPEKVVLPAGQTVPFAEWLGSVVSGAAVLNYNVAHAGISYTADLELELNNELTPFPMKVSLRGGGTGDYAVFENLSVTSEKFAGTYRGSLGIKQPSVTGTLTVGFLKIDEKNSLSGNLSVSGRPEDFQLYSSHISVDSLSVKDLLLEASLVEGEAAFSLSASLGDRHGLERGESNLLADGTFRFDPDRFLELSLSAEELPLEKIIDEFFPLEKSRLPDYKSLLISTQAYLTTNFDRFSFSLFPLRLEKIDGSLVAEGSVNGNNDRLRIGNTSLKWPGYDAAGDIELRKIGEKSYSFRTAFTVNALFYDLEGVYHRPGTLLVRGNYDLSLTALFGEKFSAISARMKDFPLPLSSGIISEVSFNGRGIFRDEDRWNFQVASFSAAHLPELPEDSRIEFSGNLSPGIFQMNELSYSDTISTISGDAELLYRRLWPLEGSLRLNLESEDGREIYRMVGARKAEHINADIQIQNFRTDRIADLPFQGIVNTSLQVSGTWESPLVEYSFSLEKGEFRQKSVQFESTGRYSNRLLDIGYLRAEYDTHILQRGEGSLDLRGGILKLDGQYRGIFMKKQSSAELSLRVFLHREGAVGLFPVELSAPRIPDLKAELDINKIRMFGKEQKNWRVDIEKKGGEISFEGGPEKAMRGKLGENGMFFFQLASPLPVRCVVEGNTSPEAFGISVREVAVEADFLSLLGVAVVEFESGIIKGGMDITGAPNDPLFEGTFTAEDFSGRVKYIREKVKPFTTEIVIRDTSAVVNPVTVSVGGGSAVLSGGFGFDRWNLDSLDINVRASEEQPVPVLFRMEASGLNVEGFAYGLFNYAMRSGESMITGSLTAQNCVINLEEGSGGQAEQSGSPLMVDLDLSTGKRVEFLWPRRNFPILQAFLDTGQKINVKYDSMTSKFQLKGEIDLKSGELYYFQRSFYIEEGTITFNENENKFDPLLLVDAQIREIDNSGRPVTISFLVDNEPLSSFTPRFESSPQLTTVEIASILGTNLNTQFNQGQGNFTSALMLTGDLFSQFSIVRSFEQQMKDVFKLDLFSIRTQMIQNVILERVLNQNIARDPEAGTSLGQYLDNTTLFLGKYLGNDLFFEALVQIQQEPVIAGDFVQDELNFTMELGLEWKTPFFLLNLAVSPDFIEPMNSIENTSLGFSWDFSY
jgi:hypothetical protein